MKNQIFYLNTLIILTTLFFCVTTCYSQAKATGHVFAEIVETISITSQTNDYIRIEPGNTNVEFKLGEIQVRGSNNSIMSVLVTTEFINGELLETAGFDAFLLPDSENKVFNLLGVASKDLHEHSSSNYSARYEVTFAYN
jgi:hypothetical protein